MLQQQGIESIGDALYKYFGERIGIDFRMQIDYEYIIKERQEKEYKLR